MQEEFPDQQGWSPSNLRYMRRIARVWPTEDEFSTTLVENCHGVMSQCCWTINGSLGQTRQEWRRNV